MAAGSALPPVPHRMDAQVRHDGVRWRFGPLAGRTIPLVAFVASTAAGLGLAIWAVLTGLWLVAALGVAPLGLVALAATRVPAEVEVHLTDRRILVEVRRLFDRERRELRLDELDELRLADPPSYGGSGQLVVRAGHDVLAFGRDQPREHNIWFADAIETALAATGRRERMEGREYSFMRVTPEPVESLLEAPSDGSGDR